MWDNLEIGKIMKRPVRDKNQKIIMKAFMMQGFIAQGDDWKVFTVTDQQTMKQGTLKMITKKQNMPKERKDQIYNEIQNQKKMKGRHNFVNLEQVFEDSNTIYLLMQKWGTPLQIILDRRQTLMEKEVQLIFCQLVDILQNLRSANINHGNINLFSVLLTENDKNQLQLTNFSNSQDLSNVQLTNSKQCDKRPSWQEKDEMETLNKRTSGHQNDDLEEYNRIKSGNIQLSQYTSPEQYNHDREFNKRSLIDRDIWSCGVLLFKLLTGTFPFSNQNGTLNPNKIKNATFSFPKLDSLINKFQYFTEISFKNKFNTQFISLEWKQLLKKMISNKNDRISIKELINHPFRLKYFELKLIPSLRTYHPCLCNLFSTKPVTQSIYQKAWKVNFQNNSQSDEQQTIQMPVKIDRNPSAQSTPTQQNHKVTLDKISVYQSLRQSTITDQIKEQTITKPVKMFRIHKTAHCSPIIQSAQSLENHRYQTTAGNAPKQKSNKQREESLILPVTCKFSQPYSIIDNYTSKQPPYIMKFKYFKKGKWFGYILNNSVGVVFDDGEHVVGHNQTDYKYIQQISHLQSEILMDNTNSVHFNQSKNCKQILKNQPRFTNPHATSGEDSTIMLKKGITRNYRSEQVSTKDFQNQLKNSKLKYTNSNWMNVNSLNEKNNALPKDKLVIYYKALQYFGERVVLGPLDLWVDKFWKDGNIYIFLMNTGCWQVAFLQRKGFKVYAIDQNQLSWFKDISDSPDLNYAVRQIIRKYQSLNKRSSSKEIKT